MGHKNRGHFYVPNTSNFIWVICNLIISCETRVVFISLFYTIIPTYTNTYSTERYSFCCRLPKLWRSSRSSDPLHASVSPPSSYCVYCFECNFHFHVYQPISVKMVPNRYYILVAQDTHSYTSTSVHTKESIQLSLGWTWWESHPHPRTHPLAHKKHT